MADGTTDRRRRAARRLRAVAAVAALTCVARSLEAANPACTLVTSVPYRITSPGLYCLPQSLDYGASSGTAILVDSDDVTLDFNGFTLQGTAGNGTFALGVSAQSRRGLTIQNGAIGGFLYGILVTDDESQGWGSGGGHRIRDMNLFANYFRGLRVEGRGDLIERCRIADTGGTTIFGPGSFAFGIEVFGPGVHVLENIVDRTTGGAGGEAVGISVSEAAQGTVVEGNIVTNDAVPVDGESFGLWAEGDSSVLLLDNRFARLTYGGALTPEVTGTYRDNLCAGCARFNVQAANPAAVDAGNND